MVKKFANESFPANAYLNFARLFSQTRLVMLYPGSPASPIPDKLYRRVSMHANKPNATHKVVPLVLSPSKLRPNSPIPFPPLSPLLLDRSYPIWCSERFFSAPSRDDAWEECLWQVWLNSYGHLSALPGSGLKVPSVRGKSGVGSSTTSEASPCPCRNSSHTFDYWAKQEIIHRRLSNRFRHESCVLAAKRLKDRSIDGKVDPRKSQWLRKTCRQVRETKGPKINIYRAYMTTKAMTGWAKALL